MSNPEMSNYIKTDDQIALEQADRVAKSLMEILGKQCLPSQLPRFFADELSTLRTQLQDAQRCLVTVREKVTKAIECLTLTEFAIENPHGTSGLSTLKTALATLKEAESTAQVTAGTKPAHERSGAAA